MSIFILPTQYSHTSMSDRTYRVVHCHEDYYSHLNNRSIVFMYTLLLYIYIYILYITIYYKILYKYHGSLFSLESTVILFYEAYKLS